MSAFVISAVLFASAVSGAGPEEPTDLAVVVHPDRSGISASLSDLRALFTRQRQTLKDGSRVSVLNAPARSATRVQFDRVVLRMSPDEAARYWMERRVRGGGRPPRSVSSSALILRVVARNPNVIAYVPASVVTPEVHVLRIVKATPEP